MCVISGFRHEVDENYVLLRYYTVSSGNFLPTFQDNLSVPSSWGQALDPWPPEDGIDRLSRNVGKKLPPLAA